MQQRLAVSSSKGTLELNSVRSFLIVGLARLCFVAARRRDRNKVLIGGTILTTAPGAARPDILEMNDEYVTWVKSSAVPLL